MASSTGLYDDSDRESMSNALSPTDGYFNERHSQPQDVLVPDPSQSARADKEREVREEIEASRAQERSSEPSRAVPQHTRNHSAFSPPTTPSRRHLDLGFEEDSHNEASPLLHSAPPAYSPPTSRSPHQHSRSGSQASAGGYNTMGRPELFPSRSEPEDLGGQSLLASAPRQDGWLDRIGDWVHGNTNKIAKYVLIILALILGIGFIVDALVNMMSYKKENHSSPITDIIGRPEIGIAPKSCPTATSTGTANFIFDSPGSFMFAHVVKDDSKTPPDQIKVETTGELHIRPTTNHHEADLWVETEYHWTNYSIMERAGFDQTAEWLYINFPQHIPRTPDPSRQCIHVNATIWIRPGQRFENLTILTQTLSIIVHEGVWVHAENIQISSITGHVSLPNEHLPDGQSKSSRNIRVHLETGSITGRYPLYDSLELITRVGSINVDVNLKEASRKKPLPASLRLTSSTGSITVDGLPVGSKEDGTKSSIPDRDYQSYITTNSGSIRASLIHGSVTELSSNTGSIGAHLKPYGPPSSRSDINVKSGTGSIDVNLHASASHPGEPLPNLYGKYKYQSGHLSLLYPYEWEGELHGKLLTGSFGIDWPDMQLGHVYQGPGWKIVDGFKGHGNGTLEFEGKSGSASLKGREKGSVEWDEWEMLPPGWREGQGEGSIGDIFGRLDGFAGVLPPFQGKTALRPLGEVLVIEG